MKSEREIGRTITEVGSRAEVAPAVAFARRLIFCKDSD